MDSKPLISIITPSYNQAGFLEACIQSVLTQDYTHIEYLIVDGGSQDGSVEIIRRYQDRITWWVSEKDKGQADAFNKGLNKATGKYIGWLNSDDLYMDNAVAQAIDFLEANPELAFVFGNVQSIDENGNITNIMRYSDWQLPDLMRFKMIGQPAVFMRADLVKKVGGLDTGYHFLLDHQLWLKLAQEAPIRHVDRIWAAGRFHSQAKNIAHAEKFGQDAYNLVAWMENNPDLRNAFREDSKKILAGAHRMNARYLLDGKQYQQAFKVYRQGLMLDFMTIAPELHRMFYALLAPYGMRRLKDFYLWLKFKINRPDKKGKKI
jgi:glycosyltransferase involved in cell wall biosynthesis